MIYAAFSKSTPRSPGSMSWKSLLDSCQCWNALKSEFRKSPWKSELPSRILERLWLSGDKQTKSPILSEIYLLPGCFQDNNNSCLCRNMKITTTCRYKNTQSPRKINLFEIGSLKTFYPSSVGRPSCTCEKKYMQICNERRESHTYRQARQAVSNMNKIYKQLHFPSLAQYVSNPPKL